MITIQRSGVIADVACKRDRNTGPRPSSVGDTVVRIDLAPASAR